MDKSQEMAATYAFGERKNTTISHNNTRSITKRKRRETNERIALAMKTGRNMLYVWHTQSSHCVQQ